MKRRGWADDGTDLAGSPGDLPPGTRRGPGQSDRHPLAATAADRGLHVRLSRACRTLSPLRAEDLPGDRPVAGRPARGAAAQHGRHGTEPGRRRDRGHHPHPDDRDQQPDRPRPRHQVDWPEGPSLPGLVGPPRPWPARGHQELVRDPPRSPGQDPPDRLPRQDTPGSDPDGPGDPDELQDLPRGRVSEEQQRGHGADDPGPRRPQPASSRTWSGNTCSSARRRRT